MVEVQMHNGSNIYTVQCLYKLNVLGYCLVPRFFPWDLVHSVI